ncbi:hypothetical protein BLNAU_14866 [Blattamonas nauphoetae]|uniref:Uncharacterized protein n=1 Tax=Blattamonas nauphoetae TaxID=2049346 RepID=A0ABQ9XFJ9_9EUKA|nr:hypothetical protein BLNAU_14866 [Blattamonas nauphoetae]
MEEESETPNNTNDFCLNHFPDPRLNIDTLQEPFLFFDENTELSFEDKSTICCSLVALVKAQYPFDDALQCRAAQFLENLELKYEGHDYADKLVTELVHSSAGSTSGFVESILTLVSCPHSTVVAAALSFLLNISSASSSAIRTNLVETDLIPTVFATVQPHTLSIAGNDTMMNNLVKIIKNFAYPASPSSLEKLSLPIAVEKYNIREMIFQKVVLPSSQFVRFLSSNRNLLNERFSESFMDVLIRFIGIGLFHRPTLEFVLASPIPMVYIANISFIEHNAVLWDILVNINRSLCDWKEEDTEVGQSAKQMMQALFSEGIEDTLEQTLKNNKNGYFDADIISSSHYISQKLGSNVDEAEE